jgi:glyceraldehyde 3-phosphate dehydrogenase
MALRVAINGFGRIGRLVLRSIAEHGRTRHRGRGDQRPGSGGDQRPPVPLRQRARPLPRHGHLGEDWIDVGMGKIKVTAERDPKLPHAELNVDIAFECTGIFTAKDKAAPT